MSDVKRWLRDALDRAGYVVFNKRYHHVVDGFYTLHSDHFRQDAKFQAAYERGLQASAGVNPHFEWRVHIALWFAAIAMRADGDFVECGVNAGFLSSAIMHSMDWNRSGRRFYLVDTFEGPELEQFSADEIRLGRRRVAEKALAAGAYVTDLERVQKNFSEWPDAHIIRGRVPEVLSTIPLGRVAFLHVDLNCAYPERAALEFFWPRLSEGAVVLLDDYAHTECTSQTEAIDGFAQYASIEVLSLPTGQGVILK